MKKNNLRLIILMFFTVISVNAQNRLEPLDDIFSIYDYQFEYYSIVRKKLFENLSDKPYVRFLVIPSFSGENVLQITENRDSKYLMQFKIAETSIWYSKEKEKVKIKSFQKEISKQSADLLQTLFKKVILKVEYPSDQLFGSDGTNYYFMIWDFGIKGGKIWSPNDATTMGELVKIGESLIEFCQSDQIELDEKLISEINDLFKKL